MKVIIDCDKPMERKDLKKVVDRKKGAERERTGRKEGRKLFIVCASLRRCIRVPLRP